jgi:predicted RNA binding protein YcfA (HicA-like mRNA interferase family)
MRRRIAQRPSSVRFAELERLLTAFGFTATSGKGSHVVFKRGADRLAVPDHGHHVKATYVRQALQLIAED